MRITNVEIKLAAAVERPCLAYATITFDGCFIVRDLRIIAGANGPIVVMPDRVKCDHCPACRHKTPIMDKFCGKCGLRLAVGRDVALEVMANGKAKRYYDVAHPLNSSCREVVNAAVLGEFRRCREECQVSERLGP